MIRKYITQYLLSLSRFAKTSILLTIDYFLLVFSFWISLTIRINSYYFPSYESFLLIVLTPLIAIPIYYFFGLYNSLIRYSNNRGIGVIITAVTIYTILWFALVFSIDIVVKPYDFLAINWLISIFLTTSSRLLAKSFLSIKSANHKNVIIYGAGDAGIQLESAIKHDPETQIVAFIDDTSSLHGKYIQDIKIFPFSEIEKLINNLDVQEVLLAIPSASRNRQSEILDSIKKYPVIIRKLPGFSDLAKGRIQVSDLKRIKIEDLLKREIRKPNKDLLKKDITGKRIMITGAGGSIGTEISKQIIQLDPELLILYEISEPSLYEIDRKLRSISNNIEIHAILGDVINQESLERTISKYKIHTVFHTAAYKHVPMVEENIIPGVRCNIFGTLACINAAINQQVSNFVFISTDKAVRPTNIMGATKRFSELILQAKASKMNSEMRERIRISIVRFGNVLGSSGSVVPLFRQQINQGGPVTVTHPEIIRYFMTIKEAAQLVIQAGAIGKNGEIFLLDMGEQVSVISLAMDMIRLSGMTVKDESNPDGDIEIEITGLRSGEKLYEEMLIDDKAEKTEHDKIFKGNEPFFCWSEIEEHIDSLRTAIQENNSQLIINIFSQTVDGYIPYDRKDKSS